MEVQGVLSLIMDDDYDDFSSQDDSHVEIDCDSQPYSYMWTQNW